MEELERARGILGMEERRVARAEACRRLHEVKLDGGSHEMLSALARAVMPDATMGWTVGACERLRAHLVWLLGAGMPEIQAMGEDAGKYSNVGHSGPQIGSQGLGGGGRMSITKELREFIEDKAWMANNYAKALAIADRIDAEHDRALMEMRSQAYNDGFDAGFASADDWLAQHEDAMAEHGWVRKDKRHIISHATVEVTPHIDWSRMADELDEFVEIVRGMAGGAE